VTIRKGRVSPVPVLADIAAASPVPEQMGDSPIGRNSSEFFAETNSNLSFESGLQMALTGEPSPGADVGRGEPSPGADVGRGEPSPGADVGRGEPSPGADLGRGEPSLCADAAAARPVPVQIASLVEMQMWQG